MSAADRPGRPDADFCSSLDQKGVGKNQALPSRLPRRLAASEKSEAAAHTGSRRTGKQDTAKNETFWQPSRLKRNVSRLCLEDGPLLPPGFYGMEKRFFEFQTREPGCLGKRIR